MTISTLPTPPQRSDTPADFVTKADAFIAALPTFVTETNATANAILAAQGGLPVSCLLTFSTTTTDSDPGTGTIRFNNATQNATTALYIDLLSADAGNPDITALLDWLDDSTSTSSKGVVKLYKTADSSKWIYFNLTAWTTATGYRKFTAAVLAASAANPFANSDGLTFQFWRTGDAGSVAGGVAMTNANITGIKEATYDSEINNATTTGAVTINWQNGHLQLQAAPTGAITYSFTAPASNKPCHLQLRISQGATAYTPSFPGTVKWLGATWAAANSKTGLVTFYFDGTNYWATGANEV